MQRTFKYRGIVEGFFGPPWSLEQRCAMFEFGAQRAMNCYLYAPKDDPFHRERWREPYPEAAWDGMRRLVAAAQANAVEFVYGFHPGHGLRFGEDEAIDVLLAKARRFHEAGVRRFAVLFDDIPSRLAHAEDERRYGASLARAEGAWLARILERQPRAWAGTIEWWICPSYYSEDPALARSFGDFEPQFLEKLRETLPEAVACMWTGPSIVSERITLEHVERVAALVRRPLVLWDNYPVNDLAMSEELHLGPLIGRDARLPERVLGYLNNPLLQPEAAFLPLATCFDYAGDPAGYDPELSWTRAVRERFGASSVEHWATLRAFCDGRGPGRTRVEAALSYFDAQRALPAVRELQPWIERMRQRA
jgi:hyaluronoglucosaminidase